MIHTNLSKAIIYNQTKAKSNEAKCVFYEACGISHWLDAETILNYFKHLV